MEELKANIIYVTGDHYTDPKFKDKCNLIVETVYCKDVVIQVDEEPDDMEEGDIFLDGSIFANNDIFLNQ